MRKIVLFTTEKNKVWTSMQEILPMIESSWETLASKRGHDLTAIPVDKLKEDGLKKYRDIIFECDLIVVQAFNVEIAQALRLVRSVYQIDAPWVFYLHGLATVGLWPLMVFGLKGLLSERDIFVGTCEGDREALKLAFPEAKYFQTRFITGSDSENLPDFKRQDLKGLKKLVYVGRLSRQKNLHTLIWLFGQLKKDKPDLTLHLYGKEDHLGSPNMGVKGGGYLDELRALAKELNLCENDDLFFHGFVPREEIANTLRKETFLFTSLSLHSDENFGMAAQMALECGGLLLLSHWGGHQNFQKHYPKRVQTIPVSLGTNGPFIAVDDALEIFKNRLDCVGREEIEGDKNWAHSAHVQEELTEVVSIGAGIKGDTRLKESLLLEEMLSLRSQFIKEDASLAQKVFKDYQDPNAHEFFKCYGAIKSKDNRENKENSQVEYLPWVRKQGDLFKVADPHKGEWQGNFKNALNNGYIFSLKKES